MDFCTKKKQILTNFNSNHKDWIEKIEISLGSGLD